MDEMPSSSWNRSGYRACILVVFLVLGTIATVCCCISFYTADEPKEEEPVLETLGNLSRIQRATSIELGSNAKSGEITENKEIRINGTVKDEILAHGIPTLTGQENKPKNVQDVPINPLQSTNTPLTNKTATTGSIVAQKNPNSDASPIESEINSSSFEDGSPQIDFVPKTDPKFNANHRDTRPEINSASDSITENPFVSPRSDASTTENNRRISISINRSEFDQRNGGLILPNDTNSVTSRRFNLRSVETSPGIEINEGSDSSSTSNVESGTEDIEMISASNETIPDTDQNYKNDLDPTTVGANTDSTEPGTTNPPEKIAEEVESRDIPQFEENYIENGPVTKPLTAAVEQLELPSSFDNHINTEQKFLLKESNPNREGILLNHVSSSLNKLMREDLDMSRNSIKGANRIVQRLKRSVQISPALRGDQIERRRNSRFENVKKGFVGYPNYYGLWYKYNPNRERMYRESLHKSDEFENIPLSLYMDNVLDRMAYVDSAKIDTSNGDQPLYMKKFYRKFANAMPQDPTESGSSSAAPESNQDASPVESSGSSTPESNEDASPVASSGSSTSALENNQDSPAESQGSSSSAPENNQDSPAESQDSSPPPQKYGVRARPIAGSGGGTSSSTSEYTYETIPTGSSTSEYTYETIPTSSTTDYYTEIPERPTSPSTPKRPTKPTSDAPDWCANRRHVDRESCSDDYESDSSENSCSCDFNCDDLSDDFDCEEMCKLRGKICVKKAAEDSLSQDTKILKKNDARMKRDVSSIKNLRMSRRVQEFMKQNFNLFSILVPKREIVRQVQ